MTSLAKSLFVLALAMTQVTPNLHADKSCTALHRHREFVQLKNFREANLGVTAARLYQGDIYVLLKKMDSAKDDASGEETALYAELRGIAAAGTPYIDEIEKVIGHECCDGVKLDRPEFLDRLGLVNHIMGDKSTLYVIYWPMATSIPSARELNAKWHKVRGHTSSTTGDANRFLWVQWTSLKTVSDTGEVTAQLIGNDKINLKLADDFVKNFIRNPESDLALQCLRKKFANR